ncbi:MAG: hypothetical protein ABI925_10365 [Verrucomicrobiota bacterium]
MTVEFLNYSIRVTGVNRYLNEVEQASVALFINENLRSVNIPNARYQNALTTWICAVSAGTFLCSVPGGCQFARSPAGDFRFVHTSSNAAAVDYNVIARKSC